MIYIQKRHAYVYISGRFISPQETSVKIKENKNVQPSAKCVRCESDIQGGHIYTLHNVPGV